MDRRSRHSKEFFFFGTHKTNLLRILLRISIICLKSQKQFNFFNGETGIILTEMTYSDNNYDTLYMVLLDPQYDDEKKTFITVTNLETCVAGLNFM